MDGNQPTQHAPVDDTITARAGLGPNPLIKGWHKMLADLLHQLRSFLQPGQIVTFRDLTSQEKETFERLLDCTQLRSHAVGLYLPPSVRNQMMYTNRGEAIPEAALRPADDGAVLFSPPDAVDPLINVLLAHPPHVAAIDVYAQHALLAGYTYASVTECLEQLQSVVDIYLKPRRPGASPEPEAETG